MRFFPMLVTGLAGLLMASSMSACQQQSRQHPYFPLGNGASYHYQSSYKVNLSTSNQRMIVTNSAPYKLDGKTLYPQTFHNGRALYYELSDQGIVQIASSEISQHGEITPHENPLTLLKYPLKVETRWSQVSQPFFLQQKVREINAGQASLSGELVINPLIMEYEITAVDETITVPAGRFENCIKVSGLGQTKGSGLEIGAVDITVEQTEWYAPNVGLIKMTRSEVTNLEWARLSHYVQELDRIFY